MLDFAIKNLYRSFNEIPKPEGIHACPCCMTSEEVETLLSKPLHELTGEDLSTYSSSALLTVGHPADYLYLLPRILEISIIDDSWWPDIEISARAIKSVDPETWPKQRREAFHEFLLAAIGELIHSKRYDRIDDWLCAIAAMDFDLVPFLNLIERDREAVLEYFRDNGKTLSEGRLENAFWELPNPGHDAIIEWFGSEPIAKILFDEYGYRI